MRSLLKKDEKNGQAIRTLFKGSRKKKLFILIAFREKIKCLPRNMALLVQKWGKEEKNCKILFPVILRK